MNRTWLAAAMMAAGCVAQAKECRPDAQQLTIFTPAAKNTVPIEVLMRAKYTAGKVLAGGGVTVEWAKGDRPLNPLETFCGERMTVAFDSQAEAGYNASAMAYTRLNAGSGTEIHIFYDRVSRFNDRQRMPEFLGHVLAHEIVHVLQGVSRHSEEGLMKAHWNDRDLSEMVRKPLPFAAEDVELVREHFAARLSSAAVVSAGSK